MKLDGYKIVKEIVELNHDTPWSHYPTNQSAASQAATKELISRNPLPAVAKPGGIWNRISSGTRRMINAPKIGRMAKALTTVR